MRRLPAILVAFLLLFACGEEGGISEADTTGTVQGVVYIDRNADGRVTPADAAAEGTLAALILDATGDTLARATVLANGTYAFSRVPIGRYRVSARIGRLADTLFVAPDSAFSVIAGGIVQRNVRITYPTFSITALRALANGRRVATRGIATNGVLTFGDSTVHLRDATGWLRAVQVTGGVGAGDSVSVVGTTATLNGQRVLTSVVGAALRTGVGVPQPDSIATALAGNADGGALDAAFVLVAGTITATTLTPEGDRVLTVDDGSGPLSVGLDQHIAFLTAPLDSGALLAASGVLVPTGTGIWQLKPRSDADLRLAAESAISPFSTRRP